MEKIKNTSLLKNRGKRSLKRERSVLYNASSFISQMGNTVNKNTLLLEVLYTMANLYHAQTKIIEATRLIAGNNFFVNNFSVPNNLVMPKSSAAEKNRMVPSPNKALTLSKVAIVPRTRER